MPVRMTVAALTAATLALGLPAGIPSALAAPAITAPSSAAVAEHDHIRTTLHGAGGPVVVLIPGMSTPGAVWDDEVAALAATHRLLVVEVRGFDGARAAANEGPGLIDGIVADLSADLAARGIERATIAGHSLGGLIAMKFALTHPAQADRLLIVDALPFFGTVFDPAATVESIAPRAAQMRAMILGNAEAMRAAGAKGTTSGAGAAVMALDGAAQVKIANWSLKAEPTVVAQALYEDMQMDLRRDIGSLALPVTILYQAQMDPAAATARYESDYAALSAARLTPVDRTSHFIMLDRPDAFRAALAELLARPR